MIPNTKKKITKYSLIFIAALILLINTFTFVPSFADDFIIALDAGHGGYDSGAVGKLNGVSYEEKDINLKITNATKKYLSEYLGVKVVMTRENDEALTTGQRVSKANRLGAELLVSIHNNSSDNKDASGSLVCAANSTYRQSITNATIGLGETILKSLNELGLRNRGLYQPMANTSTYKATYPDGSLQDYFGIVMRSIRGGFPGIIVECAFLSCENDIKNYLSIDEQLDAIGEKIALGIAKYYKLSKETPYESNGRIGVDARSLNFTEENIVNLLYPLDAIITKTESGALVSKKNNNPKCYLDYMGMSVNCDDYNYVKLKISSEEQSTLKLSIGWYEEIEPNDSYAYRIDLIPGTTTFTLDFSKLPEFTMGFNFIQFELYYGNSFEINDITFVNEKEIINLKAGENIEINPATPTPTEIPTNTPSPTNTPTAIPTNTPEVTETITEVPSPTQTEPIETEPSKATDSITENPTEKNNNQEKNQSLSSEGIVMAIILVAIVVLIILLIVFTRKKR